METWVLWIGAAMVGALFGAMLGSFAAGVRRGAAIGNWPKLLAQLLGVLGGTASTPIVAAILGKPDTLGPYALGLGLVGVVVYLRENGRERDGVSQRDLDAKATVALIWQLSGGNLDAATRSRLLQVLLGTPERFAEMRDRAMENLDRVLETLIDSTPGGEDGGGGDGQEHG